MVMLAAGEVLRGAKSKKGMGVIAVGTAAILALASNCSPNVSAGTKEGTKEIVSIYPLTDLCIGGFNLKATNVQAWIKDSEWYYPQDPKWTSTLSTTVVTQLCTKPGNLTIYHQPKPPDPKAKPTPKPTPRNAHDSANDIDPNFDPNADATCPTQYCVQLAGHLSVKQWYESPPVISDDANTQAKILSASSIVASILPGFNDILPRSTNSIYQITDPFVELQAAQDANSCSDTAWNNGLRAAAAQGLSQSISDFSKSSPTFQQISPTDITVRFTAETTTGDGTAHMPIDAPSAAQYQQYEAQVKKAGIHLEAGTVGECKVAPGAQAVGGSNSLPSLGGH